MTTAQLESRSEPGGEATSIRVMLSKDSGCDRSRRPSTLLIAVGLFLFVVGVYALTSPGRIDIVDGQARFDVTYNWLVNGRPIMKDNWIGPFMSVPGRDGLRYSYYGAPASIFAMPLVGWGLLTSAPAIQPSQFLFSLTSPIFGAGIAAILFLFYLELGITVRKAVAWTLVSSFATYIWPISNSTFDNAQHAFFVLAAVYLGFISARRKSLAVSLAAGCMAGVLVLYQEYFLLLVPALALTTLGEINIHDQFQESGSAGTSAVRRTATTMKAIVRKVYKLVRAAWAGPGEARCSCIRYGVFLLGVSAGLLLSLAYNDLRFGSWLQDGKLRFATQRNYPLLGNPIAGFLTLLVSPGKSIFLYSPVVVLAILGARRLFHRAPVLLTAIGGTSLILVLFISCISFAGGDWCWGPRYLTLLLPLWALALPFALNIGSRRRLAFALIGLGFLIQIAALSVENQRFFFDRGLNDFFWAEDPWFYLKNSALFARIGEAASLREGVPATAHMFTSLPVPIWTTYTVLGPPANVPRALAPGWIRNFQIFFLPKPWPLWMSWLPPDVRPIRVGSWLLGFSGVTFLGASLIYRGYREGKNNERTSRD